MCSVERAFSLIYNPNTGWGISNTSVLLNSIPAVAEQWRDVKTSVLSYTAFLISWAVCLLYYLHSHHNTLTSDKTPTEKLAAKKNLN